MPTQHWHKAAVLLMLCVCVPARTITAAATAADMLRASLNSHAVIFG